MPRISGSTRAILIGVAVLGFTAALLIAPGHNDTDRDRWETTAELILDRSFEGEVVAPVPAPARRSSMYISLLIAALLSVLYAYRRRRYIAEWIGAWLLVSLGAYVVSRGYANLTEAQVAIGIMEIGKVGAALLILRSVHSVRQTPSFRYDWLLLVAVAFWLIGAGGRASVAVVLAPAYLIAGVIYTRAAVSFAVVARRQWMLGALLIALGVGVVGVSNVAFGALFGFVAASGALIGAFLTVNSLAFITAAFGMHLLVFEEIVYELKATNHELETAHQELREHLALDALTGCYNRRFLEQNLDRELQRHRRYRTPLSVLFADIDGFKDINDSYGHDVGDQVLRQVGEFLKTSVREADYVVRWGGDEFLILMTCTYDEARAKGAQLRKGFDAMVDTNVLPAGVGLSVGHAEVPIDATEIESTIRIADRNMYLNKTYRRPF